jgi:hypothetical protein
MQSLTRVLGGTGLALWIGGGALWYSYAASRPPTADPASGRVWQLNTHGSYAYLTRGEVARLAGLLGGGWVAIIASILLRQRLGK